jgi:hypothetical protein
LLGNLIQRERMLSVVESAGFTGKHGPVAPTPTWFSSLASEPYEYEEVTILPVAKRFVSLDVVVRSPGQLSASPVSMEAHNTPHVRRMASNLRGMASAARS